MRELQRRQDYLGRKSSIFKDPERRKIREVYDILVKVTY